MVDIKAIFLKSIINSFNFSQLDYTTQDILSPNYFEPLGDPAFLPVPAEPHNAPRPISVPPESSCSPPHSGALWPGQRQLPEARMARRGLHSASASQQCIKLGALSPVGPQKNGTEHLKEWDLLREQWEGCPSGASLRWDEKGHPARSRGSSCPGPPGCGAPTDSSLTVCLGALLPNYSPRTAGRASEGATLPALRLGVGPALTVLGPQLPGDPISWSGG